MSLLNILSLIFFLRLREINQKQPVGTINKLETLIFLFVFFEISVVSNADGLEAVHGHNFVTFSIFGFPPG